MRLSLLYQKVSKVMLNLSNIFWIKIYPKLVFPENT